MLMLRWEAQNARVLQPMATSRLLTKGTCLQLVAAPHVNADGVGKLARHMLQPFACAGQTRALLLVCPVLVPGLVRSLQQRACVLQCSSMRCRRQTQLPACCPWQSATSSKRTRQMRWGLIWAHARTSAVAEVHTTHATISSMALAWQEAQQLPLTGCASTCSPTATGIEAQVNSKHTKASL